MKLDSNTILITGGATGIGLALAERFLQAGSTVAICGRREDKLQEAHDKHPQLITRVCDVANADERAAILNVTSGLAFTPLAFTPVYCATKAALHSFTLSLRHQLAGTSIEVIEIISPAVNTDLGGPGLHTQGASLAEFADSIMAQLQAGSLEASFGFSAQTSRASREELDAIFQRMNQRR